MYNASVSVFICFCVYLYLCICICICLYVSVSASVSVSVPLPWSLRTTALCAAPCSRPSWVCWRRLSAPPCTKELVLSARSVDLNTCSKARLGCQPSPDGIHNGSRVDRPYTRGSAATMWGQHSIRPNFTRRPAITILAFPARMH